MTTVYSDQMANNVAVPRVLNEANIWNGRVRIFGWTYTTPTGGLSSGDIIQACIVPRRTRIIGGRVTWGAMGTSCTAIIGPSGDTNKYLTSLDVSSAGDQDLADSDAEYFMTELTADETILITTGGGDWDPSKKFNGYLLGVID